MAFPTVSNLISSSEVLSERELLPSWGLGLQLLMALTLKLLKIKHIHTDTQTHRHACTHTSHWSSFSGYRYTCSRLAVSPPFDVKRRFQPRLFPASRHQDR